MPDEEGEWEWNSQETYFVWVNGRHTWKSFLEASSPDVQVGLCISVRAESDSSHVRIWESAHKGAKTLCIVYILYSKVNIYRALTAIVSLANLEANRSAQQ